MLEPINHQHSMFANKTVEWFTSDSLERFTDNLAKPNNRATLERNNWIDKKIEYTFNSHGFRADEFEENSNSILFLGCSFTLGTGLTYEHTWPYLVSQEFGLKNYNLGISGGSNDSAFRLGNHYIPKLKPSFVVFAGTGFDRLDVIDDEVITLRYNWIPEHLDSDYYKDWVTYRENGELNWCKNQLAIKYLCKEHSIPYIYLSFIDLITWPLSDNGRDIIHPGIGINSRIAEKIIQDIKAHTQ